MRDRQSTGRSQMACQIFSECIVKYAVVVIFALVWSHFINRDGSFRLLEHTFFTAGAIFLAAAWFRYLKLDQVCIYHLLEKKKRPRRRQTVADMADYVETELSSSESDVLNENQKTVCHLMSDILAGVGLILISIIVAF